MYLLVSQSQMTSSESKRTKKVANLRMHVERAINRIKTYRNFMSTLPISMLSHADDIGERVMHFVI